MSNFLDYFSQQASLYVKYRPQYPSALFEYLVSIVSQTDCAWDCGCGNGQASVSLKAYFNKVIGTDPSASQIANAVQEEGIIYRVEPGEKTTIESQSIDLVTVAQALHWLKQDIFYEEVRRVLKPSGIIAVWSYLLMEIDEGIDQLIRKYYRNIVRDYFPPEIKLIEEQYQTIYFPFQELDAPKFSLEARYSLPEILAFLETWSGTQNYISVHQRNPLDQIEDDLTAVWGDITTSKLVRWPLYLRLGRLKELA
ncbi:MAG TPA: SAM-dependent methyltransferase [Cyanothece sp. UBA12306]|nr:SAM-dependent methyltransferase [Cyanothece sp. UBA12306]